MTNFARSLGWEEGAYREVIGLRDDERHRLVKAYQRAWFKRDRRTGLEVDRVPRRQVVFPLAKAGITKVEVRDFWERQSFDLDLRPHESNCDLCFLKGRRLKESILSEHPELAQWWVGNEGVERGKEGGDRGWFNKDYSYASLVDSIRWSAFSTVDFYDRSGEDEEYDAECGLTCASDEAGED